MLIQEAPALLLSQGSPVLGGAALRLFASCTQLPWQHNTACPHTASLGDAPSNVYSQSLELLRDGMVLETTIFCAFVKEKKKEKKKE